MLDRNETPVYYALRVYRGLKNDDNITSKTPYDNSFGFRLTESAAGYKPMQLVVVIHEWPDQWKFA